MRGIVLPLACFAYLNALFTFENVASTPAVRLAPKLSLEVVLTVALLAAVTSAGWGLSRIARGGLAGIFFGATLIRYLDVTALGVLGREFNLHGDFPHLHRVFAMFWEALSWPAGVAALALFLLVAALAVSLNWVALGSLQRVFESRRPRRLALGAMPLAVAAFAFAPPGLFSTPVTSILAKQIGNLRVGEAEKAAIASIDFSRQPGGSNLDGLGGANVFLIFLESYGVTLIEDPHHFDAIEPRYRGLERRLGQAGYAFSSSQIHSPTFGGGSWRAHATLLSGFHAESEHLYNALIDSNRKTLAHFLDEKGYRSVAAEPGIKWYWPDGAFYGFDRIYDFDTLDYDGPPMGWWKIPDQFTLYRIYKDEIRNAERPLFAKFSLIMTHIPYYPVPSYVEDWTRFDDKTAYSEGLRSVAHDAYRDLTELSSWYLDAFRYELDVLEGFLMSYVPENSLVIIVGDHQPPKLATHDNDSWAVPMHVLSKREELVRAFDALGFEEGLVPSSPSPLRMADFLPGFLDIFDAPRAVVAGRE